MQLLKILHPVLSVRSNKTTCHQRWNYISDFSDMLYGSNVEFSTSLIFILVIFFIHLYIFLSQDFYILHLLIANMHKDFQSGVKLKYKIISHYQVVWDISFKAEVS